jgi:Nucleotidyltransferase of unknown function (DUF6036)
MPVEAKKTKLPEPWRSFLAELDKQLQQGVELHCLGGFVLTVLYGVPRITGDIDYLTALPAEREAELRRLAGPESVLARTHRVYLQRVGVEDVPDGYDGRLIDLRAGLKKVRLLALEAYDLVLSKLTRNHPKDREDAKYLIKSQNLDPSILRGRFQSEMKPWLPNVDRHRLTLDLWIESATEVKSPR